MRRGRIAYLIITVLLAFVAGVYAATTQTQEFSGVITAVNAGTFSVQQGGKETWVFDLLKTTKGTPKVGDKVTVTYKMVALAIAPKQVTADKKKKTDSGK